MSWQSKFQIVLKDGYFGPGMTYSRYWLIVTHDRCFSYNCKRYTSEKRAMAAAKRIFETEQKKVERILLG